MKLKYKVLSSSCESFSIVLPSRAVVWLPNASRGRRGICETRWSPESGRAPSTHLATRNWHSARGLLYVKELGSSRSRFPGLGDHFADPWLSGGFTSRVWGFSGPAVFGGVDAIKGLPLFVVNRNPFIFFRTQKNRSKAAMEISDSALYGPNGQPDEEGCGAQENKCFFSFHALE